MVSIENPEKRAEAITAEAEQRAAIVQRHRLEWEEHRRHLKHAIDEADFESAKLAKITAETLQIYQAGERRAWSLDSPQYKPDVSISAEINLQTLDDVELERIAARSALASKSFPAWFLGRYPDKQIISASYNSELANDFGRAIRNLVATDEYRRLFPAVTLASDSQAANRWHTNHGGAYVAAGVGTAITGRGAHVALIDDPIKDWQEASSETIRRRVWEWVHLDALHAVDAGRFDHPDQVLGDRTAVYWIVQK